MFVKTGSPFASKVIPEMARTKKLIDFGFPRSMAPTRIVGPPVEYVYEADDDSKFATAMLVMSGAAASSPVVSGYVCALLAVPAEPAER
jgi:hypothetical protein